jgi:hypothetical protein
MQYYFMHQNDNDSQAMTDSSCHQRLSRHLKKKCALDGQTDSMKKNGIRLFVVNPSSAAVSEKCSTARQIQSKRTEFVCPSKQKQQHYFTVSP